MNLIYGSFKAGFIVLLLFFCFGLTQNVKSQNYVTIKDTAFVRYLKKMYPSCMKGKQLDTTCSEILAVEVIDYSGGLIDTLDGIQYFKNLKELYWNNSRLSYIPKLPGNLEYLDCEKNRLIVLPTLPASLLGMNCSFNMIDSLPDLPDSMSILTCIYNKLKKLPALPDSIGELNCGANVLVELPQLPASLFSLDCQINRLSSLPTLPKNILNLLCGSNKLTALPALPDSLFLLDCEGNQIPSLPALPAKILFVNCGSNKLTTLAALPKSIEMLACDNNFMEKLPALPLSLRFLSCTRNQLTGLPTLHEGLEGLQAGYNDISCFPLFPSTLEQYNYFDISPNPFTCLPNFVDAMDAVTRATPLCTKDDKINNPKGCDFNSGISAIEINKGVLNIYPNPGNGVFHIVLPNGELKENTGIEVYNAFGVLVLSAKGVSEIDLSMQPVGIYLVKVIGNNAQWSERILKI